MSQPKSEYGRVMTAQEVSDFLKIPLSTVWSLSKQCKLRAQKIGKHWRYLESDVIDYLRNGSNGHDPVVHERREKPRARKKIPAILEAELPEKSAAFGGGEIDNISEKGIFFIFATSRDGNERLSAGDPVTIAFKIPGMNGHGELRLRGTVARKESNGTVRAGIEFADLDQRVREMIRAFVLNPDEGGEA